MNSLGLDIQDVLGYFAWCDSQYCRLLDLVFSPLKPFVLALIGVPVSQHRNMVSEVQDSLTNL